MAGEPAVSLKALNRCCGGGGGAAESCRRLLGELYERVLALLSGSRAVLEALSGALLERESLEGADAERLIDASLSNERQEAAQPDDV